MLSSTEGDGLYPVHINLLLKGMECSCNVVMISVISSLISLILARLPSKEAEVVLYSLDRNEKEVKQEYEEKMKVLAGVVQKMNRTREDLSVQ